MERKGTHGDRVLHVQFLNLLHRDLGNIAGARFGRVAAHDSFRREGGVKVGGGRRVLAENGEVGRVLAGIDDQVDAWGAKSGKS